MLAAKKVEFRIDAKRNNQTCSLHFQAVSKYFVLDKNYRRCEQSGFPCVCKNGQNSIWSNPKFIRHFEYVTFLFCTLFASCFCNLDKLNKNDNEMNNGEVKRTRKILLASSLCMHSDKKNEQASERSVEKKSWAKINENAYQDSRPATHRITFSVREMRGIFFVFSCKENVFFVFIVVIRVCWGLFLVYDNSKKFYHANEMFNRVSLLPSFLR